MFKNNKGSMGETVFALAIIFLLFMAGSLFINPIKDSVTDFRTNVGCAVPADLSDGEKLLCLGGDATVPYFIILLFATMGGILLAKFAL
jgi:hypothetical protein